jgi:two-component system chemotaxis sensor kinase CheA
MSERLSKLTAQLAVEISTARANDTSGQFPILDLIGNLRDEALKCGLPALEKTCGDAWEKMVQIVESGKAFSADEIVWLNELQSRVSAPAATTDSSSVPAAAPVAPLPETAPANDPIAETPPLELNLADDAELLREFINESREHLDNIEHGVLVLENNPRDAETLNTVFRAFHTFKGGAGFLNLIPINRLAHILESLLDQARQGKLAIDAGVIGLILRGRDTLKNFVDEIDGQLIGAKPCQPITIPTEKLKREAQDVVDGKSAPAAAPKETAKADQPAPAAAAETADPAANVHAQQSSIVKVDTTKLDGLLDLVGEMVIAQSLVSQHFAGMIDLSPQFTRDAAQLSRITKELQRVSMSLRMVPIRGVFQKMSRVVRDIGVKYNKKVELLLSGEDTELDRGVVEELNDPLLHMIRNSMDHGIESAEKRLAAGKPAQGTLHLRAYHQGGNIVVEVEDDGAGLSRERILKKAIERGLATPDDQLTDEDVFKFIFAAGFSTAEKITDLSGRGVGLDVMRRNIERMRGRVEIESKLGTGTKFKISLPLTLAIIDGFIVRVGEERYVIPTLSVRESFRPQPGRRVGRAGTSPEGPRAVPHGKIGLVVGFDWVCFFGH